MKGAAEASAVAVETAEHFRDLKRASYKQPPVDGTFYMGKRQGELLVRIQDKVADRRNPTDGTKVDLPPCDRRTRVEIQIGYGAFGNSGAIYRRGVPFGFQDVMRDQFRLLLPTITTATGKQQQDEVAIFRKAGAMGLDHYQRAFREAERIATRCVGTGATMRKLGFKGHGVAWSEFNKRGRDALAYLDRQWVLGRRR